MTVYTCQAYVLPFTAATNSDACEKGSSDEYTHAAVLLPIKLRMCLCL